MTPEQFELYYQLKTPKVPFRERLKAAMEVGHEALLRRLDQKDIPLFYREAVSFWRSLGMSDSDRTDPALFGIRRDLGSVCLRLSFFLPGGQKFFRYYPRVKCAEGFRDGEKRKLMRGKFSTTYGSSLYDFHREYPIEGFGVGKDQISVITDEDQKLPVMEWCRQNHIIVFCNRCGLDITYTNANDCPFMKSRYKSYF